MKAVAMDMWPTFANSAERHVPEAEIMYDCFHISKHLNEAVDKVRRQEHKALRKEGDTHGHQAALALQPRELE